MVVIAMNAHLSTPGRPSIDTRKSNGSYLPNILRRPSGPRFDWWPLVSTSIQTAQQGGRRWWGSWRRRLQWSREGLWLPVMTLGHVMWINVHYTAAGQTRAPSRPSINHYQLTTHANAGECERQSSTWPVCVLSPPGWHRPRNECLFLAVCPPRWKTPMNHQPPHDGVWLSLTPGRWEGRYLPVKSKLSWWLRFGLDIPPKRWGQWI